MSCKTSDRQYDQALDENYGCLVSRLVVVRNGFGKHRYRPATAHLLIQEHCQGGLCGAGFCVNVPVLILYAYHRILCHPLVSICPSTLSIPHKINLQIDLPLRYSTAFNFHILDSFSDSRRLRCFPSTLLHYRSHTRSASKSIFPSDTRLLSTSTSSTLSQIADFSLDTRLP